MNLVIAAFAGALTVGLLELGKWLITGLRKRTDSGK